jgi:Ca2+/Na+ antiporter
MKMLVYFYFTLIASLFFQIDYQWLFYITLAIFLVYVVYNSSKAAKIVKNEQNQLVADESDKYLIFNELEKNIIKQIIDKSKNNEPFTVYELNILLGVKNKSIEIQKKTRTESIIRINHKFNVNYDKDTVFIERVRSIEDRRYFNYFINEENMKVYLKNE